MPRYRLYRSLKDVQRFELNPRHLPYIPVRFKYAITGPFNN